MHAEVSSAGKGVKAEPFGETGTGSVPTTSKPDDVSNISSH